MDEHADRWLVRRSTIFTVVRMRRDTMSDETKTDGTDGSETAPDGNETEPDGAEGNEQDNIEDFPEDNLPANAQDEMRQAVEAIAELLDEHKKCECPVCSTIYENTPRKMLRPLEGLASRIDQFIADGNDDMAVMYMSSLMTASAQVRSQCKFFSALSDAAHEAYAIVETKTTVAVAKMTTEAIIGGDAKVLVGKLIPGMEIPQGWPSGGSDGGSHGPN
jgi:hypothetical protein